MIQGVIKWCESGSESLPAINEWGESLTATCFTFSPNDILAQSADATETETSGENLTTKGGAAPSSRGSV